MTDASDDKRHFFVSFNQADRDWATWIAWVLEEKGYSVFFQDWDFRGSFIEQMHQASLRTGRTLVVLSDHYLHSEYTRSEAWAALAHDPVGREDRVVTVKVGPTTGNLGLFSHFAYLDLTTSAEADAERLILERARKAVEPDYRAKPSTRPGFPGGAKRKVPEKPGFPGVIHNLPHFNPDFVGREQVLAELHRRLTSGRGPAVLTQAITGLGGVGKTQTALTYAYRHFADYHLVWWLRAENAATLAADYSALAEPLGLDPAAVDQEKLMASVRAALQAREDWLLVFDNVEEPEIPRAFLPTTGQGHVLITSRRTDWQSVAKVLELEVMKEGEALQLLTGHPDPDTLSAAERAAAETLAKELGYLPLALAQARAYMAGAGKSLAGYRRLFEASRPAVLERGRASQDYPTSVAKTWQISIEAAESECAAARPLLELLAFFAPDILPMEVLASAPATLPEGLGDELERDEAIAALHRFSLLRAEAGTLTVHRLVQTVTRDGLDAATAKTHAEAAVRLVNAALPDPPEEHTNWPAIGALLPHALATAEASERLEAGPETAATVLNDTALYHYARAAYSEAEPLYKRSLSIFEKALGPDHPHVGTSLNNLAELYRAPQGKYGLAEPLYKRSLSIFEKALGPDHPLVGTSLNNLAELYQAQGKNLAELYQAQGKYDLAEPLYKRSLSISEKALGPDHPDVGTSLNNLASLYRAQGKYDLAEPLYKRSLSIREKALGPDHPLVGTSLNNLASLYQAQGKYDLAVYKRSLSIREKALGPDHPDVGGSLNNLAGLYRAPQGKYDLAEPLYKRSLSIREKALGPDHPDVGDSLNNLAGLYRAQGKYDLAEPLYKRSLAILEKTLPLDHPHVGTSLNNLAGLYRAQGKYDLAEPLYKRSLAILEKTLPLDHPHRMRTLESYGRLLDQLGRHAEAAELRAQTPAIR